MMKISLHLSKKRLAAVILLSVIIIAAIVFVGLGRRQGVLHSMSGVVTKKFTDCVGGEEMDSSGKISKIAQVSCDGGSTITIDGNAIFTTSTGLLADQSKSYSVDVSSIAVGDSVVVKYSLRPDGYRTLHCSGCSITKR